VAEVLAAQRDASWFNYPSHNGGKYHVFDEDSRPRCGVRTLLVTEDAVPAREVSRALRCARPGCKQAFAALDANG